MLSVNELRNKSSIIRRRILDIVYNAKAGHIGGDLSVCDILNYLYGSRMRVTAKTTDDPNRDYFILSKGHCVEALYSVLCEYGFLSPAQLAEVGTVGTKLIGHPNNKLCGIEMNSGSLGHGLSVGVGLAIASKMDKKENYIYVVMGDGELAEGSIWEAAMSASHYKLDNLVAIIDRNGMQISGTTEDVMSHECLGDRFKSFGWHVQSVNGNDYNEIDTAFKNTDNITGKPKLIIANTRKGSGVSFIEDKIEWHHKVPSEKEYALACKELEAQQ